VGFAGGSELSMLLLVVPVLVLRRRVAGGWGGLLPSISPTSLLGVVEEVSPPEDLV